MCTNVHAVEYVCRSSKRIRYRIFTVLFDRKGSSDVFRSIRRTFSAPILKTTSDLNSSLLNIVFFILVVYFGRVRPPNKMFTVKTVDRLNRKDGRGLRRNRFGKIIIPLTWLLGIVAWRTADFFLTARFQQWRLDNTAHPCKVLLSLDFRCGKNYRISYLSFLLSWTM